ncbi:MAG: pyridine nucleotide-disulfide oxidoreductase/dicluster-binding protein [Syntrophobacteraceae bacterium]
MEQKELRELENKCIQEQPPACTAACPIHVDVRAINSELSRGNFGAAQKLLRKTVPFPGIISRICDQPCREVCKRREAGSPISIRDLERACLDHADAPAKKPAVLPGRNKRVAVVGGGLGGLTVAFDLAKKGYDVVVFEIGSQLGGRIWRLPEKVLPVKVIEKDLELLKTVGADIRLNVEVGKDISLSQLIRDFDALYMTVGRNTELPKDFTLDELGRVRVDPVTFETSVKGVFSRSGKRPKGKEYSPIQAIADGRRAAISIDRYLQGVSLTAVRTGEGSYETTLYTSTGGIEPLPAVPMPDPERGYSGEEAVREAGRCMQCQCLECVKVCEYLNAFHGYPKKYVREIYNNLSIVMGMRHANKLINSCSICGLCREVCPNDLHMGLVCKQAREALVEMGKMPPSAHDFPIQDMLFSNSEKCAFARHQPGTKKSRYLFFPGCQLSASAPEHVKRVYATLSENLDGGVGLMLRCCGAPADWSGRSELFESILQDFLAVWEEMNRPELIAACSTCYEILKTHLPRAGVLSLWEVFDRLEFPEPGKSGETAIAVHDACTTRHEAHIHESIRNILRRMGFQVVELPLSRDKTECCGYGGLMFFANPQLAKEVSLRRTKESSADYVAYCSMCRDYFASMNKRTWHMLDLIYGSPTEDAAVRRGPGYSQRRENRVRLRDSLAKELWGESMGEKEGFEEINLIIPDQVRESMEARLILNEDIQKVIDFGEKSGNKILNRTTGHFITHYKPTSVTYWVEYSVDNGRYTVYNAYSHRMEIVGEAES